MDPLICPQCGVDWRKSGVKEYGLVKFSIQLRWNGSDECFDGVAEETTYGDCASMEWACWKCGYVLDDSPDNLVADSA